MTSTLSIRGSGIRRLKIDEVVEVIQGPERDSASGVMRVLARTTSGDPAEGWVTITGNAGTVFLAEGGGRFRMTRRAVLTASLAGPDVVRPLLVGEVLEVVAWSARDEKSGDWRMKVKALGDGAVGWVTAVSSQGVGHAEPI